MRVPQILPQAVLLRRVVPRLFNAFKDGNKEADVSIDEAIAINSHFFSFTAVTDQRFLGMVLNIRPPAERVA